MEKKLYAAVICDMLDEEGLLGEKTTMDLDIRPLDERKVIVGRAFTAFAKEVFEMPKEPYKLVIEAVDSLSPGEVFVATTNGAHEVGFWGELLTHSALNRGARGAIIDGSTRDAWKIRDMDFPLFVKGNCPLDSKGRTQVEEYQVPIKCGGVVVNPGDIIFGDIDGIVVIPQEIEEVVIRKAFEKVEAEDSAREEIIEGMTMKEMFAKYGIL